MQAALAAQAIPTAIHYPLPMHLQPAYRQWGEGAGSLPASERLCRKVLCLPMHPDLDEPTAMRIARAVRDAAGG
ncbi:MAG: DegT/DnrJ/EryC1/StrS family aminotransferase [Rhodospirillales bacterium]|nr:DegT/DnrJ/EryC1/StrS family aminotransferase [Rhodospirillales bacterium]